MMATQAVEHRIGGALAVEIRRCFLLRGGHRREDLDVELLLVTLDLLMSLEDIGLGQCALLACHLQQFFEIERCSVDG